jgi:pectate lyase
MIMHRAPPIPAPARVRVPLFPLWVIALGLTLSSASAAPDGYATVNGSTTGGAGGPTVTVSNLTDLVFYLSQTTPYIIQVQGTINLGTSNVRVKSNKTIVGLGTDAKFIGNLKAYRTDESNIIIQNMTLTNPNTVGDGDCISLVETHHIWVDHCTFIDGGDGSLDITHGSDWITVSWCKFYYTANSGHNFVNLIGHSDTNAGEDRGKLHVTFHHNWWSTLAIERMPRVRFGRVHSYNNYFNAPGNNYCIRLALESEVLLENSYFENVDQPWEYYTLSGQTPGKINAANNVFVNVTGLIPGTDTVFSPPYSYTMDDPNNVKAIVMAGAGAGGGAPPPSPPAAPGSLAATAISGSQINLGWSDNSNNEDGFKIERSTDGVNFTQIATVGANVTSYPNTGLAAATTYYYRVRAYNAGGDSGYSNTASATTLAAQPPAAPSNLGAVAGKKKIALSWTDNASNETGFKIERSTDGTNFTQIATVGANATTYTNTGLTSGTTYYYQVRAYSAAGDSAYSNVASATAK